MISCTLVISIPYSSWASRKLTSCIVPDPLPFVATAPCPSFSTVLDTTLILSTVQVVLKRPGETLRHGHSPRSVLSLHEPDTFRGARRSRKYWLSIHARSKARQRMWRASKFLTGGYSRVCLIR